MFEANERQDWKIKNERGKEKREGEGEGLRARQTLSQLTRLNSIKYLKGFHFYHSFFIRTKIALQSLVDLSGGPTV